MIFSIFDIFSRFSNQIVSALICLISKILHIIKPLCWFSVRWLTLPLWKLRTTKLSSHRFFFSIQIKISEIPIQLRFDKIKTSFLVCQLGKSLNDFLLTSRHLSKGNSALLRMRTYRYEEDDKEIMQNWLFQLRKDQM